MTSLGAMRITAVPRAQNNTSEVLEKAREQLLHQILVSHATGGLFVGPAGQCTIFRGSGLICRLEFFIEMDSSASRPVTAIYPGSFDPVTNGHLDLVTRASNIFGKLIVAVAHNLEKDPLFSEKERVEMLEAATFKWDNVQIDVFDGLLMDYARAKNASVIVRGIRAVSDYEYELQMAMMNRKIEPDIETVFMLPAEQYSYLSSRLVKELARLGGPTKDFVPANVHERLCAKFK
jgi:pantetheine-phosphate adenylyltransferase